MKKLLLLLCVPVIAFFGALHYHVRVAKWKTFSEPVFVEIERGTSSLHIGETLAQQGVVRHPLLFLAARIARPSSKPQAGEYRFTDAATPWEVFTRIARGDVYMIEVRVPEGSNAFDLARIVGQSGLAPADAVLKLALAQEGFLFPSTYHFKRKIDAETICHAMRDQFEKVWVELGAKEDVLRKTVIIASLVESEAVLDEERPRIAAVYWNRLARGMKLEADPTVEYAALLDRRWRGTIRKSNLASLNRYNTYQHAGLPPGPISNPGEKSLRAAVEPAQSKELFFVAKPDRSGGHIFSESYEAHARAVAQYRRSEKANQRKSAPPRLAPTQATRVRR